MPSASIKAAEIASRCDTIWVDVTETIRTVYGFPTEVVYADGTLDHYVADGFLRANPFAHPAPFLIDWLQSVCELSRTGLTTSFGIDLSGGFSPMIVARLRDMGFRRFRRLACAAGRVAFDFGSGVEGVESWRSRVRRSASWRQSG